jgi:hypothetical protein
MPSVFLLALTLALLLWKTLLSASGWKVRMKEYWSYAGIICVVLSFTTWALWPLLWEHPLQHFFAAYSFMSSLKTDVMFLGRTYSDVPWFYIPGWIVLTTPLLYTVFFLMGLVSVGLQLWSERREIFKTMPLSLILPLIWP